MIAIRILITMLCLGLLAGVPGPDAEKSDDETPLEHSGTKDPLHELSWLSGYWTGESGGVVMEEVWMAPRGGIMPGLHRDLFPSGKAFFEYLRITRTGEETVYHASPRGKEPVPFRMHSSAPGLVVFENRGHDFPQRIIYERKGDRLEARIEGEVKGKMKSSAWIWKRNDGFPGSTER